MWNKGREEELRGLTRIFKPFSIVNITTKHKSNEAKDG